MHKKVYITFMNNVNIKHEKSNYVFLNHYGIKCIYWYILNFDDDFDGYIHCIDVDTEIDSGKYVSLQMSDDGFSELVVSKDINKNKFIDCIKI